MLKAGQEAPMFVLPDADMELIDIARFQGKKNIILFFYPRDDSPCCTLQATDFSDHEDEFARFDCLIIGISRDDCIRHAEFRDKHGISVCLLSDAEGAACKQYGVWQAREVNGVKQARHRALDLRHRQTGRSPCRAYTESTPKGHALEVLREVKELNS
jgi:peroxiredoxin Q/BCP